ncbi:MAG: bifunctional UDP-3-O-[3-hydroxymyristoyl] N-acetylglucosamine deacetylase/3-hydroxyacyl-ACP dehydratase [Bacteroidetes bacterium]|nr:bifunctional UDP-3-O-[3-hydroxymyristoyl] N-acetylglucosamine deacetylase/3-hydroxyacyl-ACP dehydratase [Bacteroidota bacterium]MCW5896546.1 bifunctional UDP-3-O-[3-hydroxymyristoyl] N-acetylglucosamine deacetylase/3-hydroxyacyl-ACP dehydratase [Bacteroidota bacterium]
MLVQQRTIKQPVTMSGVGLHTGSICSMTFRPAPENSGIRFKRIDLGGSPEVPALVDHVVDIARGTTIAIGEARVHTVEHVLAALVGMQVDNCLIELDANEPPIGDGSAKPYVDLLLKAGFERQDAPKDYLIIDQPVEYRNEEKGVDIVALPTDDYRITVMVDYHNPALGSQHSGLFNLEKEFVTDFAPCRTFCFLHEVEMLHSQGLIKGGNLDNAIVIVDRELGDGEIKRISEKLGIKDSVILGTSGVLNNRPLHFKNEPARHKLLDMMGDLALIGVPFKAQILAARPGHASNIEFAKIIRKLYQQKKLVKKFQYERKEGVVFDINAIKKILPHRYPFLLIDKIVDFTIDERIVGVKNVTINEPFFEGHFPGQPVMPGVLIIEAMAQCGGILLLNGVENPGDKLVFFMAINNAKFRKPVTPGDQLVFELTMTSRKSRICQMAGRAYVDGNLVAEADMMASIVDRQEKNNSSNGSKEGSTIPAGRNVN